MFENSIKNRKIEHLQIFKDENVQFAKSAGFENFQLLHNSLPELNFDDIDLSQVFLEYTLSMPFIISAITGGMESGKRLNLILSEIANKHKVGFALGSMRPCFENQMAIKSFSIVKHTAFDIPVIGNLGGQQLLDYSINQIEDVIKEVGVDALAIHLNPLQEVLQPGGDKKFVGIRDKIIEIAEVLSKPIIVKEVGFGLPIKNILDLSKHGIKWFDIAGAGGTSWAKIEKYRNRSEIDFHVAQEYDEFGIPTAELLEKATEIGFVNIIASGGINCGLDFAKAIGLGAMLCGSAGKILKEFNAGGSKAVEKLLDIYYQTLKVAIFITGCENLDKFRKTNIIERC